MELKVYLNGQFVDQSKATVSVFDHGLLYGDGVFEGIRVYNGKACALEQHIDRLYESARAIRLEIPMTRGEMLQAVKATVDKNVELEPGVNYIRLVITRGAGTLGLDPGRCEHPCVIIIVDKLQLYPQEIYETGIELVTASTIRNHPQALSPRIKSLNYLNNILAKMEGKLAGVLEVLMMNWQGYIAECSADNFFIVRDGTVMTPPVSAGALKGVTRDLILSIAGEAGLETCQTDLTRHDAYTADEAFLTGSGAEVMPVIKIDGRDIGDGRPGGVTRDLIARFRSFIDAQ